MQVDVGTIIEGKVTGITNFGAFIQLSNGKTGLVHISEVALAYVKDIKDHLKENDTVKVKVLSVDDKGKVSLSIKKALEEERRVNASKPAQIDFTPKNASGGLGFEDKMKMFMQDSDEKMQDLKRNMESKRGGGYRRSAHLIQI